MDIAGKNVLVLGGGGMVGQAVCREMIPRGPARIVVASRLRSKSERAAARLKAEFSEAATEISPVWGDVFLRAEWRRDEGDGRARVLADRAKRARMIADILDPLAEDTIQASLLTRMMLGTISGCAKADIVVDCMNTSTAVGYLNIYAAAQRVAALARDNRQDTNWPEEVETLLASLYVPSLVRHVQLLYEGMRRADTTAYVKVGTSGTGGMGFNIPYTHGEERPSRLLLSKAMMAGAQTLLTFLMARTPGPPVIVKEVKPAAMISWEEIGYGVIERGGSAFQLYDCTPDKAVSIRHDANLAARGDFGVPTGGRLEGVYIQTGENGQFSADEFAAITANGQMAIVTPEEIARNVVAEIEGATTGREVVAALDAAVMGPTYRGGYLRRAALNRLRQLESLNGTSVAFEQLGPPRLSKLLFEAHLLRQSFGTMDAVINTTPQAVTAAAEKQIVENSDLRQRIISIGLGIVLSDGERLLRGPLLKSQDADHGWVDLTADNMSLWQRRLTAMREEVVAELQETSSRRDRCLHPSLAWETACDFFDAGEMAAWILNNEEGGRRMKG
jgi:NAD(P)-dependent dehydrogenase (short-subunit alcohol dehydrogenase family)